MTRPVHFFWMYGMYGPITDPGSRKFTARFQQEFPTANIHGSPYRDYDVNVIVTEIVGLPLASAPIILIGGTSLGSNNTPVVASYLRVAGYKGKVHGAFGFQASEYGEKASPDTNYDGIPSNVLFAHLFTSDTVIPFPGIGAYEWVKEPGNTVTNLDVTPTHLVHPGDYDVGSQDIYIAEMKRIIANPGD